MKNSFDWSSLDRYGVASYVWLISPKIVGRELSAQQFYKIVSTHLKKQFPLTFKNQIDPKVVSSWVYIGGLYYIDRDENQDLPITIVFQYKSKEDVIKITKRSFWKMCITISDTLLHEVIHMRQHRRRNFRCLDEYVSTASRAKIKEEQEYLGSPDEIDAYSFNIACELTEKFRGNRTQIIKYLNKKKLERRYSSWKMYLKAFEYKHKHPVIVKVKTRVLYYLRAAQRGYPYKSSKWINY
jgi:hypothetical protein